ncbi:MAG TPA: flavoprotein [Burkholderiales bacterium]|nr:flavoprotein [Burkholderiales bacterium]
MSDDNKPAPRVAWCITGSGHYLKECLDIAGRTPDTDLFLSRAAAEVLQMYDHELKQLRERMRIFRDNTASAVPVGLFYHGAYHTVVVAPATSNTIAKCVAGISDTLVTNIFAQAGKRHIPSIVFACDNEPVIETRAPGEWVTVYPRAIDLRNAEVLQTFEAVTVAADMAALERALAERLQAVAPERCRA